MKFQSKALVIGSVMAAALIATITMGAAIASAAGDAAAGKQLFKSSGCGNCHTLADAGSKGKVATNLDTAKPSFEKIVSAINNLSGVMGTSNLTPQQSEDIAAYIVSVAGGKQSPGGSEPGSSEPGSSTGNGKKSTVRVTLYKSGKIRISSKEVSAGDVTFKIVNKSKRKQDLSVVLTSKKSKNPHALSLKQGRVSETGRVGKKIKLSRSKSEKKVSKKLEKSGTYVILANKRGGFKKKRYALLRVTKPSSACSKSTVWVSLKKNRKIRVSSKKANHGFVTLKIDNHSESKQNLSVIPVSKGKSARTMSVKRGRISEKGRVGKRIKISSRKRTGKASHKKVRLELEPGKYVLIDNESGNYKKKRYVVIKVLEPASAERTSIETRRYRPRRRCPPSTLR